MLRTPAFGWTFYGAGDEPSPPRAAGTPMVALPSSRQCPTVHRTVGFNCSSLVTRKKAQPFGWTFYGAGDEARTRYLHLGKVALYRMSYTRISNADMIIADFFQKSRADAKFPEKKSPGGQKLCPPSTHVSNLRGMKQGGNKFGSALTAAYTAAACGRPGQTPARSAPASPRDRRTARARRS